MAEPLLVRLRITMMLDPLILKKAATAAPGVKLPCTDVHQEKSNWCWAAVTACVAGSYDPFWAGQQCEIAASVYPDDDCCAGPDDDTHSCNLGAYLSDPLTNFGLYAFIRQTPTFPTVVAQISVRKLVPIHITWSTNDPDHYTLIRGHETTFEGNAVVTADPRYGPRTTPVATMDTGGYLGKGTWDDLYFTAGSVP